MADPSRKDPGLTIGVDVGDRWSHWCVLDAEGEVAEEGRVRTTPEAFRRRFESFSSSRVALEVGTHSPWLHRLLGACGHQVLVANARSLPLIFATNKKDDATDAEKLARVARLDPKLLHPIRHRGPEAQRDLGVLRSRDALVRARTQLINHVRGIVKPLGGRITRCSAECFHRRALEQLPGDLKPALAPVLEIIESLTRGVRRYDQAVKRRAEEAYPETELLQQVPGVGPLTALAFVLKVEDPRRFAHSREVGPYLGLVPRENISGDQNPQLRITKAGDPLLRRLLVGCAHYILGPRGPDTDHRRWGQKIAARGGKNAKKRAAVAVARKLAVLLHRLWVTGEVYEPLRNSGAPKEDETACVTS